MLGLSAAHLFAVLVGFVSSGLVGSAWTLAVGEDARLRQIFDAEPGLLTPFRVLAAVFSAPTSILFDAFDWMIRQPVIGVPLVLAGVVWSFLQGVFILTQVFGFS